MRALLEIVQFDGGRDVLDDRRITPTGRLLACWPLIEVSVSSKHLFRHNDLRVVIAADDLYVGVGAQRPAFGEYVGRSSRM